ncbi:MAG: hypothetical protein LBB45_01690 [Methanobrevibacter sp.]|nr:hypothetical protein [Candidatus Methanovirga basalitermitum]
MAIPNKQSKYLNLVREDKHGEQKWTNFQQRNPASGSPFTYTTPPTNANHFTNNTSTGLAGDFISSGAAGDSLGNDNAESNEFTDDFCGVYNVASTGASSYDPSVNMLGTIKDYLFLLSTFCEKHTYTLTKDSHDFVLTIFSAGIRPTPQSLTLYSGNHETKSHNVTGCQINELNLNFDSTEGVVQAETTYNGSMKFLSELLPSSAFRQYMSSNRLLKSNYLDCVCLMIDPLFAVGGPHPGDFVINSDKWAQVGCRANTASLNINLNLDEDSSGGFCKDVCTGSSTEMINAGVSFRGELKPSDNAEMTMEVEMKLTDSLMQELEFGGEGQTRKIDTSQFSSKYVLTNEEGETLILGFPSAQMTLDGDSLEKDGSETATMKATGAGGLYLDEQTPISTSVYSGVLYAVYMPSGSYMMINGLAYTTLNICSTGGIPAAYRGGRIIIYQAGTDNIVYIMDIPENITVPAKYTIKVQAANFDFAMRRADSSENVTIIARNVNVPSSDGSVYFNWNSIASIGAIFGDCDNSSQVSELGYDEYLAHVDNTVFDGTRIISEYTPEDDEDAGASKSKRATKTKK